MHFGLGICTAMSSEQPKEVKVEKPKKEKKEKKEAEPKPEQPAKKVTAAEEEELDPSKYFENRKTQLAQLTKEHGLNPWPHKFDVTMTVPEFHAKYAHLESGVKAEGDVVSLGGRVYSKRTSGAKLVFYDIKGDGKKLQIMADQRSATEYDFKVVNDALKRGDIIGVKGTPGRTKTGELSIFPSNLVLLSPCLQMMPSFKSGLKQQEVSYLMCCRDVVSCITYNCCVVAVVSCFKSIFTTCVTCVGEVSSALP